MLAATPPPVPPSVQQAIVLRTPQLAYVPTRIPAGYRYLKWRWVAEAGLVRIWFRNSAGKEIVFVSAWQYGNCRSGREKTFDLSGKKVYWAHGAQEQEAWRCVAPSGGGGVVIQLTVSTRQPPTRFSDAGLGRVAASTRLIR
jgi:hypothetical protein